eukprot:3543681-Amphidinium_carterae.1
MDTVAVQYPRDMAQEYVSTSILVKTIDRDARYWHALSCAKRRRNQHCVLLPEQDMIMQWACAMIRMRDSCCYIDENIVKKSLAA